jgi:dTDP-glucose 4,6-dehydratase
MKLLITGGAGFIGSAVIRQLNRDGQSSVLNLDKLTYAANLRSLVDVDGSPNYSFEKIDICDQSALRAVLNRYSPDAIMHLAAESHVDRSIDGPSEFIQTNIIGTYTLLTVALDYYKGLPEDRRRRFRFHHISTDEVFGSLDYDGFFTEQSAYDPRSPYSASKAASDHLVSAWHHTYGLPIIISNCSNNYGPFQFPEKLIPLTIINALNQQPLPVYGNGENVRDWVHVEDHAKALLKVLRDGEVGQSYLIGGQAERQNIEVVRMICDTLNEVAPCAEPYQNLIEFVEDRPGHDHRYAIDMTKFKNDLGWEPEFDFETGLHHTVSWYLENRAWWEPLYKEEHGRKRLGLNKSETA